MVMNLDDIVYDLDMGTCCPRRSMRYGKVRVYWYGPYSA